MRQKFVTDRSTRVKQHTPPPLFFGAEGMNILSTILFYLWIVLPAQRGGIQFSWQSFGQTPEAVLQVVSLLHFPQLFSQRSP